MSDKPMAPRPTNRTVSVDVRMTEQQKAVLATRASHAGVTISEFVRRSIFGGETDQQIRDGATARREEFKEGRIEQAKAAVEQETGVRLTTAELIAQAQRDRDAKL